MDKLYLDLFIFLKTVLNFFLTMDRDMVLTRHRAREENDNIQIRNKRQNVEHSNSEELQIINTDEQCCSSYNGQSQ